jgi:hypothetical protein
LGQLNWIVIIFVLNTEWQPQSLLGDGSDNTSHPQSFKL